MTIQEATFKDFPELVLAVKDMHEHLLDRGSKISEKSIEEESNKLSMIQLLSSDVVESLEACFEICMAGFYESNYKLLRSCFEGSFMLKKLNKYPEDAFDINKNKKFYKKFFDENKSNKKAENEYNKLTSPEKEKFEFCLWFDANEDFNKQKVKLSMKIFSVKKIIEEVLNTETEKQNELRNYHILSKMAHSRAYGLGSRTYYKTDHIKTSPAYMKDNAEAGLKNIFTQMILCNNSLFEVCPNIKFNDEENKRLEHIIKKYGELV